MGGLVGWWVGGLVGWWVGGLVGWWVGGLVGLWVGGLVGRLGGWASGRVGWVVALVDGLVDWLVGHCQATAIAALCSSILTPTVGGRNPIRTTLKPWLNHLCWQFTGESCLRWCEIHFVHPQYYLQEGWRKRQGRASKLRNNVPGLGPAFGGATCFFP